MSIKIKLKIFDMKSKKISTPEEMKNNNNNQIISKAKNNVKNKVDNSTTSTHFKPKISKPYFLSSKNSNQILKQMEILIQSSKNKNISQPKTSIIDQKQNLKTFKTITTNFKRKNNQKVISSSFHRFSQTPSKTNSFISSINYSSSSIRNNIIRNNISFQRKKNKSVCEDSSSSSYYGIELAKKNYETYDNSKNFVTLVNYGKNFDTYFNEINDKIKNNCNESLRNKKLSNNYYIYNNYNNYNIYNNYNSANINFYNNYNRNKSANNKKSKSIEFPMKENKEYFSNIENLSSKNENSKDKSINNVSETQLQGNNNIQLNELSNMNDTLSSSNLNNNSLRVNRSKKIGIIKINKNNVCNNKAIFTNNLIPYSSTNKSNLNKININSMKNKINTFNFTKLEPENYLNNNDPLIKVKVCPSFLKASTNRNQKINNYFTNSINIPKKECENSPHSFTSINFINNQNISNISNISNIPDSSSLLRNNYNSNNSNNSYSNQKSRSQSKTPKKKYLSISTYQQKTQHLRSKSNTLSHNTLNLNLNFEMNIPLNKINNIKILKIESLSIQGTCRDSSNLKPNQDKFFTFIDKNDFLLTGICDGHGKYGHIIAEYASKNLPELFKNLYNDQSTSKQKNDIKEYSQFFRETITKAYITINDELISNSQINTVFSGATCNSIFINPSKNKLFCCNIGDSRAILCQKNINVKTRYDFVELSNDHNPNSKEESSRIIKCGGRIRQFFSDKNNQFYGKLRVWDGKNNFPGLEITRTFGDEIGKKIGVICEPEIYEYNLDKNDKFIIIGSDGLWEYMDNYECMNIVKKYYEKGYDCKGAVKKLCYEAYSKWINLDKESDDITCTIIFFE